MVALLLFVLLDPGSLAGPAAAATPSPATVQAVEATVDALEADILNAVNETRRARGLAPLRPDGRLHAIARAHSEAMGRRDVLAHRDPTSGSVADRARAAGISFRAIGENIERTRGMADPVAAVVHDWMQSPGHRANILSSRFQETGVGIWHDGTTYYVTQVFLERPRPTAHPRGAAAWWRGLISIRGPGSIRP